MEGLFPWRSGQSVVSYCGNESGYETRRRGSEHASR